MERSVKDADIVLVEHKDAGKQAFAYYQGGFYEVGFMLGRTKEVPESSVKGVYFPSEDGGLEKISVKAFKDKYKNVKALQG